MTAEIVNLADRQPDDLAPWRKFVAEDLLFAGAQPQALFDRLTRGQQDALMVALIHYERPGIKTFADLGMSAEGIEESVAPIVAQGANAVGSHIASFAHALPELHRYRLLIALSKAYLRAVLAEQE